MSEMTKEKRDEILAILADVKKIQAETEKALWWICPNVEIKRDK